MQPAIFPTGKGLAFASFSPVTIIADSLSRSNRKIRVANLEVELFLHTQVWQIHFSPLYSNPRIWPRLAGMVNSVSCLSNFFCMEESRRGLCCPKFQKHENIEALLHRLFRLVASFLPIISNVHKCRICSRHEKNKGLAVRVYGSPPRKVHQYPAPLKHESGFFRPKTRSNRMKLFK